MNVSVCERVRGRGKGGVRFGREECDLDSTNGSCGRGLNLSDPYILHMAHSENNTYSRTTI